MKILISTVMAIGLVFAVGLVYADEGMPIAADLRSVVQDDNLTYGALDNGVTFVGVGEKAIECSSEGGMAAGGMAAEGPIKDLRSFKQDDHIVYSAPDNGVTFTGENPALTCSWARGLGRDLKISNGITIPG